MAQGEQNVWVFGTNAGIDFNSGSPIAIQTNLRQLEGTASICDRNGKLLFYTRGDTIFDRNYNPMPNGGLSLPNLNNTPVSSQTQPAVIVQMPGSESKYYVFINTRLGNILYYCIVDMALNNGLGDVIVTPQQLISININVANTYKTEKMAVINGADCNFWIVIRTRIYNEADTLANPGLAAYMAFEITENGVNENPVISRVGNFQSFHYNYGALVFSHNGTKAVIANVGESSAKLPGVELYDFNSVTGELSNAVIVDTIDSYGVCFSPDNTKLYVSVHHFEVNSRDSVYQYDLTRTNIMATRIAVGGDSNNRNQNGAAGYLKMGPDRRIYRASLYNNCLDAINYPDLPGVACGYVNNAIVPLSQTSVMLGLPNEAGILRSNDTISAYTPLLVCFRDSIKIGTNRKDGFYQWNTGAITDSITITAPGLYTVGIHKSCAYYIDSFHIEWNYLPELYTTKGKSCSYVNLDTAIIMPRNDDTIYYTYYWYSNNDSLIKTTISNQGDTLAPIAPGNYKLRITSMRGCDTIIHFTIDSSLSNEASFAIDTVLCQGQTYTFQNTSTGGSSTWYWDFGEGHTATQRHPEHTYTIPGKYRVTLIAANSMLCYDTFYRDIVVDTLGQVSFFTDKKELCVGENIGFYPDYTADPLTLQWNFGNGSRFEGSGEQLSHAYDKEGKYSVILTASFRACPDTIYVDTLTVHALPIIDLGSNTALCPYSNTIVIGNRLTNQLAYTYIWNAGATTANLEVKHPGIYSLKITNESGCSNTGTIEVKKDCYIDIPNAFTPNGDGINDYFFPRQLITRSIIAFRMQVFSRWGERIFETTQADGRGWDGKLGGKEQPGGVYVYLIDIYFLNGKHENFDQIADAIKP